MGSNQWGIKALSISLFICIFTATGLAADPNLVAHWPLDGDATDSSGYAHHGTVHGDPSWVAGVVGSGAIQMDGVDDHIEIENYTGVTGTQPRTVTAWINADASTHGAIVMWGDDSVAGGKWLFRINHGGQLRVSASGGSAIATTDLRGTGWHHVAVVLTDDETVTTDDIQFYIDGMLDPASFVSSVAINTTDITNVTIGATPIATLSFEGMVDDLRIYDRALSEAEIDEIIGPILAVSDNAFTFPAMEGGANPADRILTVHNSGGGIVNWSMDLADKPDWLTVTPISGSLGYNENENVTLSVDATGLSNGRYSYSFQVDAGNAFDSPQTLTVHLRFADIWVPVDYATIQAAIDAAIEGDTIGVLPGRYVENITLKNGVALVGSGDNTIIDGNHQGPVVTSYNNCDSGNCDLGTLLEGFMIINGDGDYDQGTGGGGMYNYRSSPTVTNCTFSGNTASQGGGMHNYVSSPTITNCTFSDNTAGYSDGGRDPLPTPVGYSGGGGMYNYGSNPTLTNCTFSENTASYGGGMYNYGSNPTVTNCTFSDNTTGYSDGGRDPLYTPIVYSFGFGGGMCNYLSSPTVSHCMFSDNTASRGGGMYNAGSFMMPGGGSAGPVVIKYCTFDGNQASHAGGGVYAEYNDAGDLSLTVSNCKFVGNAAEGNQFSDRDPATIGRGGALYLGSNGSCEMVNCTLMGNRAYEAGGGMCLDNYRQTVSLTNCILWGNSATLWGLGNEIVNIYPVRDIYTPITFDLPVISHCDIAGSGGSGDGWNTSMGVDGGGNIDADPLFEDVDGAIQFDGLDDYVAIPDYKGIGGSASRTCSAWIRTTQSTFGDFVTWGSLVDTGAKWAAGIKNGVFSVRVYGGNILGSTVINDGSWHHVAVTWKPDTDSMLSNAVLYVDGVRETISSFADIEINTGAGEDVHIGNFQAGNHFRGLIGDVRVYSRALSRSEIQQVMDNENASTADLEGHWKLDGNATDNSGNSHHGTVFGGPVWTTEHSVDGAIQLDGVDDYIEIENYTGVTGTHSRTVTAWINADASTDGAIVMWGDDSVAGGKWLFRINTDGQLRVSAGGGYVIATTDLRGTDWHHVAVVLADDGTVTTDDIQVYVDGILDPASFVSSLAINTTDITNVTIGATPISTLSFEGMIDDVRIYSRALSRSEIQQVMDDENAPTADLEAHWKLDGNADDASGNNHHGTLCAGPVWAIDRFAKGRDNLRLKSLSPCINAGDKGALPYTDIMLSNAVLYVDGVPETIGIHADTEINTGASEDVHIGNIQARNHFQGLIGDVRIYSRVLSPSEIQQVMDDEHAPAADLEAHWKLDGNADDASGNNRHGTLYGGPVWVTEDSIEVVSLDGVDDYVGITDYKGITGSASRTCSAWIRTTQSTIGEFVTWGSLDTGGKWSVGINNSVFSVRVQGGHIFGSTVINDGSWHHIAVTWEPEDILTDLTDLDENPRVIDGQVDMGAYEYQNERPIANAGDEQTVYAWVDGSAEVVLDGTGSTDADGDALVYFWYNDAGELIAEGAEPEVVLEVGEHVITLIVNDGIEDSEPDSCIVTVVEVLEGDARVLPRVFNQKRHSDKIIGWLSLPEGIGADALDPYESMRLLPGDIEPMWQRILPAGRGRHPRAGIVAIYAADLLRDELTANTSQDITLVVKLESGQFVYGTDSIRVIDPKPKVPKKHEKKKSR